MAQKRNHAELFEYDEAEKRERHHYSVFHELYFRIPFGTNDGVRQWLDCNEGDEMLLQAVSRIIERNGYKPPLHCILLQLKDVSLDVVERFIKIFPESVKHTCGEGLPLHIAIKQECSDDIINTLLRSYPDGVLVKNYYGESPLHIAIQKKNFPLETIRNMVQANQVSLSIQDSDWKLPLHHICDSHVDILEFLLH